MRPTLVSLPCALAFLACTPTTPSTPSPAPATPPVVLQSASVIGSWEGEMAGPNAPILLTLHLRPGTTDAKGTLEILGQSLDMTTLTIDRAHVHGVIGADADSSVVDARLVDGQLVGTYSENGSVYPFTLVRLPDLPAPANRIEAWRQDLDALATRIPRVDRSLSDGERALFLERVEQLKRDAAQLEDAHIIMGIAQAMALANNGHTRLYILRNRTELRRLPVRLWWFADGLYVLRATPEHRDLLGCRVAEIAHLPAHQARDRAAVAFAGNASWRDYKTVYTLTSPDALYGLGMIDHPNRTPYTLECANGRRVERDLAPLPLERSTRAVEAWWDLSPRHPSLPGWEHVLGDASDALPLYLSRPDRFYWYEYDERDDLFYFHFGRASNMQDEPIEEFGARLLAALDSVQPRAFVLDVRFNTGGNISLAEPLMSALIERTRGMQRYVVTGRATFSAGIQPAAAWSASGDVTIVGEPVGDSMEFMAEGGNIILPNSRLAAHFANAHHSYSEAPCPADVPCYLDISAPDLRPDVPINATFADYMRRSDPSLEAIRADLRGS